MSRYQALRDAAAKAEYARHPAFAAVKPSLDKIISGAESLANKRAELAKDVLLSDVGRAKQLSDSAALHAPAVARAGRMLAKARKANQQKRAELAPVIKNPESLTEELRRQEIRAYLRTKPPTEAIAIVFAENAPRLLVEAVLEAPTFLHGVPAERVDQLRNAVAERMGGPQLEALREESEALSFAASVIEDARGALSDAAGFQRVQHGAALSGAFAKWFATAAGPSDDKAEAAEFAREAAATLAANVKSLGLDVDALKVVNDSVGGLYVEALKAS